MKEGMAAAELLLKHPSFVVDRFQTGDFKLVFDDVVADLYVEETAPPGVARALGDLREDIKRVSGRLPDVKNSLEQLGKTAVIVGTLGHSAVIDGLVEQGRLDVDGVSGKWEAYVIQVVPEPTENVECALVIAGSDRRGTVYGIYELSRQIGVSPWYWMADVTPDKKDALVVTNGVYKQGEPSVKYRGIFLNNEAPSLSTWVERFGGFNHKFYEKIFELILRLRGNFLWPAMWSPKSFFRDDPLNLERAYEYGVLIGTSHHEPMMRSWGEWGRFGSGEWNYSTNKEGLLQFWADGIELAKDYEVIVTVGMRGDGDEPMMYDGTVEEMVETMEDIISEQRSILAEKINPDVTKVPQAWALYKEVQDLYEAGLNVPDDVTILLANDNFGNIRMLPHGKERNHPGGFGMYYHFDYVGGPKSYRWVNSTPNPKIWEQMKMTYDYGVDRIWVVNVGDLKLHEIATEFFLDMAYDVERWNQDNLAQFSVEWARREFGDEYAAEIAHITDSYRKFTGRKKSEDTWPNTYSLLNYKEAETVLAEWEEITTRAEEIYELLPEEKRDAFYQLVLYPTRASKNVAKVNIYAGLNNLYAEQGRIAANLYADLAEQAFAEEARDTEYYNNELAGGKWRGVNSNPHMGQKGWRMPLQNNMPEVVRLPETPGSRLGIALEGSREVLSEDSIIKFSAFNKTRQFIDVFNYNADPFQVSVTVDQPWIKVCLEKEWVDPQTRIWLELAWEDVPEGERVTGEITVNGAGETVTIPVAAHNPPLSSFGELEPMTFMESDGYISIEAEHFSSNAAVGEYSWEKIAGYGRTLSSLAVLPMGGPVRTPPEAPYLEYTVYFTTSGTVSVTAFTAPTNNINRERGLCYGIAFDNQPVQIVDTFPKENDAFYTSPLWSRGVMENIRYTTTKHVLEAGVHTLRFYQVDPGVVLQKIVIDTGGLRPSYLGPPESYYVGREDRGKDKDGYLQLLTAYDRAKKVLAAQAESGQKSSKEKLTSVRRILADADAKLADRLTALELLRDI